jgi:hypothetical protein
MKEKICFRLTSIFHSQNFDLFVLKGTDPDDPQDVCAAFIAHYPAFPAQSMAFSVSKLYSHL